MRLVISAEHPFMWLVPGRRQQIHDNGPEKPETMNQCGCALLSITVPDNLVPGSKHQIHDMGSGKLETPTPCSAAIDGQFWQ
jgi:hypothetical protein